MPLDFRQLTGFIGPNCSVIRNNESRRLVPKNGADSSVASEHTQGVTRDWHLQEWMAYAKKRQAHLVSDLGWSRRRASEVFNGDQPYKRETVNELSDWLQIEPFELLLPPEEAIALRQLRSSALRIAQDISTSTTKPSSRKTPATSPAP